MANNIYYLYLGIFFTASVFHFIFFLGRNEDFKNLALSFFNFCFVILFINMLMIPKDAVLVKTTLDYLFLAAITSSTTFLGYTIFGLRKVRKAVVYSLIIFDVMGIMFFIAHNLSDKKIINYYLAFCGIYATFWLITTTIIVIKERKYKDRFIKPILLGFALTMVAMIAALILLTFDKELPYIIFAPIILLIFSFAYVLIIKYNDEYTELNELKKDLNKKIIERTEELRDINDKLEESERQKTLFFVNIAHEIKTPLTLIKNYGELYLQNAEETRELKVVKSALDKLQRDMINCLDVEKIKKGQILYDHEQITNLSDMLSEKIILFKETAKKRNISILSDIENKILIKADPYAMDRVINNLIDNAIKYNKSGGEIGLELKSNQNKAVFVVEDTGIGIPVENKDAIFLPYKQISSNKRNLDGIGMGLYIVKKIIEELKGKITVESQIGKGTIFSVTLDKHSLTDKDVVEKTTTSKPINLIKAVEKVEDTEYDEEKATILLVEDNTEMSDFLKNMLKELYNIYIAEDGSEALEKLDIISKPDIIISDIMMDKMDGIQFFDEINKNPDFSDILFIFLTAKSSIEDKIAGLSKGAVDYVIKPFGIEELKAKIHSLIKNRDRQIAKIKESVISALSDCTNNHTNDSVNKNNLIALYDKYNITEKEKEIIDLLIGGAQNKEIAEKTKLSENYIGKKISEIYKKTGTTNRVELSRKFSRS